jgi:hypothetical protein
MLYKHRKRKIQVFWVTLSSLVIEKRHFERTYIFLFKNRGLLPFWRWRRYVSPKHQKSRSRVNSVTSRKTWILNTETVKKQNLASLKYFCGWVFLDNAVIVISHRYFGHYYRTHTYRIHVTICLSPSLFLNTVSTSEAAKCLMTCGTVNVHDE